MTTEEIIDKMHEDLINQLANDSEIAKLQMRAFDALCKEVAESLAM